MYGNNGKYTDRPKWYSYLIMIAFILFLSSVLYYLVKAFVDSNDRDFGLTLLTAFSILLITPLVIYLTYHLFFGFRKVTDWELTEKGYKTTQTDLKTKETTSSEFLFSQAVQCLISPLSVSVYRANSTAKTRYNKYILLNIVYRKNDGVLDVFQFSHYDEAELYPWLVKLRQHNVPLEITDYELSKVSAVDLLPVVQHEVERIPYTLGDTLKDFGLMTVTTNKPNDYTLHMTKRLLDANKFVKNKLANKKIFTVQFLAMIVFLSLFYKEYNSDETLKLPAQIIFYISFSIFFILYLYGVPKIKFLAFLKFAGIFVLQWIIALLLVDLIIQSLVEPFIASIFFDIFRFVFYSPIISIVAILARAIRPALYHEKYRNDLEKLNRGKDTAAS
ncbi:hypothetical protein IHV10_17485 [Fictibacillus sp. 5RED26]|uniref:hypothetical protein n=1 Tax=Fictibacillus sp. 5RED26 TaxID=2745876 RepID=UPI0018CD0E51|nr:hypothetical protein [Fictibacillus sp. 5RED26]MBH0158179.1 hypothetical protein [Fictibacillus sp. 5RED26]